MKDWFLEMITSPTYVAMLPLRLFLIASFFAAARRPKPEPMRMFAFTSILLLALVILAFLPVGYTFIRWYGANVNSLGDTLVPTYSVFLADSTLLAIAVAAVALFCFRKTIRNHVPPIDSETELE